MPIAHADWRKQRLTGANHRSIVLNDNHPQIVRCQFIENTAGEVAAIDIAQLRAEKPELEATVR